MPAGADRGDAFENFEIAAYKSLLALCGNAGVDSARAPLEASLKEEERMAAWVASNVEKVTLDYVSREQRRAACEIEGRNGSSRFSLNQPGGK
ncbi:MAG: DUF892 family protein [Bradyrhizobium sp.]